MVWTEERIEQLCTLWAQGLSASKIASIMGGITRNAVIGKVHRLKLAARDKPQNIDSSDTVQSSKAPQSKQRPAPISRTSHQNSIYARATLNSRAHAHSMGATALKADYAPHQKSNALVARVLDFAPPLAAPESKNLILLELSEHTCKWPIGDPMSNEFNFCGNESKDRGPYCQFHSKLAYQSTTDRRRNKNS
jgi:GcrA cell cycle regulator